MVCDGLRPTPTIQEDLGSARPKTAEALEPNTSATFRPLSRALRPRRLSGSLSPDARRKSSNLFFSEYLRPLTIHLITRNKMSYGRV